jgi:serine/threonine-protein kinase
MSLPSIRGYRVLRRLGAGGMGEVFLARSESAVGVGRTVVIKTLNSRHANDREHAARFLDEARLAVQLDHKNICTVTHVGQTDEGDGFFLAMGYVAGRDLRDVLAALEAKGRKMTVPLALFVWREILEALDYAHRFVDPRTGRSLGIVHRDVSPSNVMVSLEGEVKLIDFGQAMSTLKEERTAAGIVIGKAAYMAPEQARAEAIDGRTDIYSTGIIGAELLSGLRYRAAPTQLEVRAAAASGRIAQYVEELDGDVRPLLLQSLDPRRERRPASAGALCAILDQVRANRRAIAGYAELRGLMAELFPAEAARQRELFADAFGDEAPPAETVVFFSRLEQVAALAAAPSDDARAGEHTELVRVRLVDTGTVAMSRRRPLIAAAVASVVAAVVIGAIGVRMAMPGAERDTQATAAAANVPGAERDTQATATAAGDRRAASETAMASSGSATTSPAPAGAEPPINAAVEPATKRNDVELVGEDSDDSVPLQPTVKPTSKPRAAIGASKHNNGNTISGSSLSSMTFADKLATVRSCRDPCAAALLSRVASQRGVDDTRTFAADLDRCVSRCRP